MEIFKYEVIDYRLTNHKDSYYDSENDLLVFRVVGKYKFVLQTRRLNSNNEYDYFIILSENKINNNCRSCKRDDYGRFRIKLYGDTKDYLNSICEDNKCKTINVKIEFVESLDKLVDVYELIC